LEEFLQGEDDGQCFFLYLAVIALTCCERLGNVGYWSFTSWKMLAIGRSLLGKCWLLVVQKLGVELHGTEKRT